MKQNLLKTLSIFILGVTSVLFSSSQSTAAILQMKKGQKVEGEYIGGSKNEVHIAVGSQILKFNVEEIDVIIFNASTNLSFQNSPKDDFSKAAREVLRVLKGLAAVTEAGVNYKEYSPRVLEVAVKINEFIEEYKDFNSEFNQHISDALGYYNAASSDWNVQIAIPSRHAEQRELFAWDARVTILGDNPYIRKCLTSNNEMNRWIYTSKEKDSNRRQGARSDSNYVGVYASGSLGIAALWNCAKSEINEAEALLKKKINAEGDKSETPKVNKGENESTDNKVKETQNTNPASVTANDGSFMVGNIESGVTDKQNPILVEWDKWVNRPKFQVLTSDLKSRVIEEYVKYIYSSSTTDQEKTDSLVSILKNYEGIDTTTTKKP